MKNQNRLEYEKKEALKIANQLYYDEKTKRKISNAKTTFEIDRVLKQARIDQDDI